MRDTTKDTERIDRIWRWIHNNIPGEPSTDDDVADIVIRLLCAPIAGDETTLKRIRAQASRFLAGDQTKADARRLAEFIVAAPK